MGRNRVPTLVSGALVGNSRGFFAAGLVCFYYLSYILVSEDSHSRMGGSDVVNSGLFWIIKCIDKHYSHMALSLGF